MDRDVLEIRHLKTTRVTIEDTETELPRQGKIYFYRRVHRHMGTACTEGQALSLLIFLM
jgi:hypothetical protein